MFSKSLFKQSCKASGTMWTIITVAVCFMLACVMLIAGNSNLAETKNAIQDTIIEEELNAELEKRSINYFVTSKEALKHFDKTFAGQMSAKLNSEEGQQAIQNKVNELILAGVPMDQAINKATEYVFSLYFQEAYANSIADLENYALEVALQRGFAADSVEAQEIKGNIFIILNPICGQNPETKEPIYMFDEEFYSKLPEGVEAPRYDITGLLTSTEEERAVYVADYATTNSIKFVSGNMIKEENIKLILTVLSKFGVTLEKYNEFGFNSYEKIESIATAALINFRANLDYRLSHMKEGETEALIIEELTKDVASSLLSSLPKEVADALEEIGQADLYGTLVGSIFFKMAGLLLPIIYLIMTANSLIAGQVDSGSMAYILSTSTKRRTVTFTQAVYLIGSLFAMFVCTTVTSLVCFAIVDVDTGLTYSKLLLMNLGAFLVMFAMSGICFLTSCFFNRSKHSMGIGGGLNMFFLVATMLGLFGSKVLPQIVRMDALNVFNYVSIISLFDVISILDGTLAFLWKLGILVAIGLICYFVGAWKFEQKDLPL